VLEAHERLAGFVEEVDAVTPTTGLEDSATPSAGAEWDWAQHADVGSVGAVNGLGEDKDDLVAQAVEGLGEAIAGDAQAAGDEGRKLPAEHEDPHVDLGGLCRAMGMREEGNRGRREEGKKGRKRV
jgi:hypothetical protein